MMNRGKLEHILAYARQQKQFGSPTCRIPPGDMVEIMERLLAQPVSGCYKLPDGWIACSERMPELDKRVLLYFGSYDGHIEDGCIDDDGDGPYHYFFDGDSLQQEPTHWMPLPASPGSGN